MSVVDRWYVLSPQAPVEGYFHDLWVYGARARVGRRIYEFKVGVAPEYRNDPNLLAYIERRLEREMEHGMAQDA